MEAAGLARSAIAAHLYTTLRGSNNLVFAARRQDVETYADRLSQALRAQQRAE